MNTKKNFLSIDKDIINIALKISGFMAFVSLLIKFLNFNSVKYLFLYPLLFFISWLFFSILCLLLLKFYSFKTFEHLFLEKEKKIPDIKKKNYEDKQFLEADKEDYSDLYNNTKNKSPSENTVNSAENNMLHLKKNINSTKNNKTNTSNNNVISNNQEIKTEISRNTDNRVDELTEDENGKRLLNKNDFNHEPKTLAKAIRDIMQKEI